jgi:hypothetical protein
MAQKPLPQHVRGTGLGARTQATTPCGIEILGLRRHHTPKTRQRPDYPIAMLVIPALHVPA